jgi:hypothetical protein
LKKKILESISVDGILDELAWAEAQPIGETKTAPDFLMLDQDERCLQAITELIRFDFASMNNDGVRLPRA